MVSQKIDYYFIVIIRIIYLLSDKLEFPFVKLFRECM